MTTTLDVVSPKRQPNDDRSAEAATATELVRMAKEQGLALTGPVGLLKLFTKNVLESALNEEWTEHLGHGPESIRRIRAASSTAAKNDLSVTDVLMQFRQACPDASQERNRAVIYQDIGDVTTSIWVST